MLSEYWSCEFPTLRPRWLAALDAADALTAAGVLLLPPFPREMTAFPQHYVGAIVQQLQAGGRGNYAIP